MRPLLLLILLLLGSFANNSCTRKAKTSQDGDSAEFKRPGPVPVPPGSQLLIDEDAVLALLGEPHLK